MGAYFVCDRVACGACVIIRSREGVAFVVAATVGSFSGDLSFSAVHWRLKAHLRGHFSGAGLRRIRARETRFAGKVGLYALPRVLRSCGWKKGFAFCRRFVANFVDKAG